MTDFVDGWILGHTLGEGAYGEVKLVINKATEEAVAMKMVDLSKHPDARRTVRKETTIHRMLSNPNIIQYFGQRSEKNMEYIFLEYASGGELFDKIEPDIGMPKWEAQKYFRQLISAVEYLHSRGVAHRDLKPENLLLDENDNLKVSDFGLATVYRLQGKERSLDTRCGTLPYVAPEVLERPYQAEPADIWSSGIILVALLAGDGNPIERDVVDGLRAKRFHKDEEEVLMRTCLSQPELPGKETNGLSTFTIEERPGFSFSQPAHMEDLLLSTQLQTLAYTQTQTQTSLSTFQKMVRRMTRFFVKTECDTTVKRLISCLKKESYTYRINECGIITISSMDRRKMPLVFKINIHEMDGKILVDFRLSKGCGLEFKRRFLKIKEKVDDIIARDSSNHRQVS
ncbi:serine/threonine-protein kinase grp isoform X3 [Belonocnema kinseyi]|uniref:serine/threonine-protein kinase grp isoform X3 n=1 Tax=Belonocnema kinseyi TaxID=2817044 RepID=UPI00143DFC66|nr:serine/threonine-protein kinase grp isoform X3 [Belonocnema kinseyi]